MIYKFHNLHASLKISYFKYIFAYLIFSNILITPAFSLPDQNVRIVEFNEVDFKQKLTHNIHFSFNSEPKWIVVNLRANTPSSTLVVKRPDLNSVTFYYGKPYSKDSVHYNQSNKSSYFTDPYPKIVLRESNPYPVYIKLTSNHRINFPLTLFNNRTYSTSLNVRLVLYGIFIGIMCLTLVYNLFLYLSTREKIYLIYVLYVLSALLSQSAILGIYQKYFPFLGMSVNEFSVHLFTIFVGITGTLFAKAFLHIKRTKPQLLVLFNVLITSYAAVLFFILINELIIAYRLLEVLGSFASILLLYAGVTVSRSGFKPGKYFVVAWSIFLTGIFVFVLKEYNIIPTNSLSTHLMPIGSALETVLLSFALADRINTLKKEKEINQLRIYEEMKKSRDLISNQKQYLEKMVEERTQSLADINKNLNATLNHLKATQIQLIEAEKMASLGQLTAGIAHEINNPINFVSSNIHPLKKDIQDILKVLTYYQELARNSNDINLKEILEKSSSLDLETSIEEITNLIDGIEEGARRTSAIVNSLKTFSRSDKEGANVADMNIGIESTLTILKSQIGPIKVETQFGPIPEIMCYSGKLNQVFMNLIDNSIDSIKDKYTDPSNGIISIRTYCDQENIYIDFYDNGTGIPNDLQNKIFEPFFTTKEVGKGTGLGLSITYGIVESHHGHIKVQSSEGSHTLITISIPMNINQIEQN